MTTEQLYGGSLDGLLIACVAGNLYQALTGETYIRFGDGKLYLKDCRWAR